MVAQTPPPPMKHPAVVLGVVALVVLSLAWGVGRYFADGIAAHRAAHQQRALTDLLRTVDYDNAPAADAMAVTAALPGAQVRGVFVARRGGRVVAVVVQIVAEGYSGDVEFLAMWNFADDAPPPLRVLRHRETPGIADFVADDLSRAFDGVSGATISARAVAQAANAAGEWLHRCFDWTTGNITCPSN